MMQVFVGQIEVDYLFLVGGDGAAGVSLALPLILIL